jgi:hypothetical protein
LSKGGGICHGITGNAWPLLSLAAAGYGITQDVGKSSVENQTRYLIEDELLAKALCFLLEARKAPPFMPEPESRYRSPDNPYCL